MKANLNFPLIIVQGATYIQQVQFLDVNGNPVNLSGYTALMNFRATVQDTGDPIISLSTGLGSIAVNGVAGTVTFTISSTVTQELADGQVMAYDLFIYSPTGVATCLLAGHAATTGSTI